MATTTSFNSGRQHSAKHNDRQFNIEKATHIEKDKMQNNKYLKADKEAKTFMEAELKIYEKLYGEALKIQNDKYIKNRQYGRIRTINDIYNNKNTKPYEDIIQIGNKDNQPQTLEYINKLLKDYLNWHNEAFPQVAIMTAALHTDETTPHIHFSKTFWYEDKGIVKNGTTKSLEQMGIQRPNIKAKEDRYNNPLQTYTQMCRDKINELCLSYGLEIINPNLNVQHKEKNDYIYNQELNNQIAQKNLEKDYTQQVVNIDIEAKRTILNKDIVKVNKAELEQLKEKAKESDKYKKIATQKEKENNILKQSNKSTKEKLSDQQKRTIDLVEKNQKLENNLKKCINFIEKNLGGEVAKKVAEKLKIKMPQKEEKQHQRI